MRGSIKQYVMLRKILKSCQKWILSPLKFEKFSGCLVIHLLISFRVPSLALGQSYDCPSTSEVILKDMGKIDPCQTTATYTVTKYYMSMTFYVGNRIDFYGCSRWRLSSAQTDDWSHCWHRRRPHGSRCSHRSTTTTAATSSRVL